MKIIKKIFITFFVLLGLLGFIFTGVDIKNKWDARVLPEELRKEAQKFTIKGDKTLRFQLAIKDIEGKEFSFERGYYLVWNTKTKAIEVFTPVFFKVNGEIVDPVSFGEALSNRRANLEVTQTELYGYLNHDFYITREPWEFEDRMLVEAYYLLRASRFNHVELKHAP